MLKKPTYTLILGVTALMFSCSEAPEDSSASKDEGDTTDQELTVVTTDDEEIPADQMEEDEVSSRYHYDEDFEVFKTAVINKDIKGVSAFASSDNIDAESIIQGFSDPDFLAVMKASTWEDLEVDTSGEEVLLVLSCMVEGKDDEGNTWESGLFLYFSQGEPSLLLENFFAAG